MKLSISLLLTLLLMLTVMGNSGLPEASPQIRKSPIIASLITSDAVLVPFAQYRQGRWETPWPPLSDSTENESKTLADLPKPWFADGRLPPPVWYFWSPRGKGHFLTASKIVEVPNHCQSLWGIVSDLPKEDAVEDRYGMIGVALDIELKVNPSYEVNKSQDEWSTLHSFLRSEFDKAEQNKSAELSRFVKLPGSEEQKNKSVTLSNVYQMTKESTGERLYYFEALKEYRKPIPANDQTCNNLLFKGWVLAKSGELKLIDSAIEWRDCDFNFDSLPLGLLELDGKVFIFLRNLGYEGEEYLIFKLSEARMQRVLATFGGSC